MLIDPVTFRRLRRARELLAADRGVREVARELAVSPFQLIRAFAALYGETPHQFRTRERIGRARRLLASGSTVTEACLEVGFSSLGSFSTLFTRWVGTAPSRYRRSAAVPTPALVAGCLSLMLQLPRSARFVS